MCKQVNFTCSRFKLHLPCRGSELDMEDNNQNLHRSGPSSSAGSLPMQQAPCQPTAASRTQI